MTDMAYREQVRQLLIERAKYWPNSPEYKAITQKIKRLYLDNPV